jgi:hypothetical protein
MNKQKFGAIIGAMALTLLFAGTALANGTVSWTGQGITNGELNNEQCDADNAPGTMLWIFTLGGSDEAVTGATLTVNGDVYTNDVHLGHIIKFQTAFYDPAGSITASVDYEGTLGSGDVNLTLSHGCPDTTTSTTTTDETTSTTTTDETTSTTTTDETTSTTTTDETTSTTTTDETTSTTSNETTPEGSVEELTPPRTDALAQPTSSSTVSTGLLLVLAGILAAALVVIPAAARSRR